MSQAETIFILIIAALFFIGWLITCHLYSLQSDRNKDLQLENTDLIDRILKLQEESRVMLKNCLGLQSKINSYKEILAKKKELLEIQDRLLDENNIKH